MSVSFKYKYLRATLCTKAASDRRLSIQQKEGNHVTQRPPALFPRYTVTRGLCISSLLFHANFYANKPFPQLTRKKSSTCTSSSTKQHHRAKWANPNLKNTSVCALPPPLSPSPTIHIEWKRTVFAATAAKDSAVLSGLPLILYSLSFVIFLFLSIVFYCRACVLFALFKNPVKTKLWM